MNNEAVAQAIVAIKMWLVKHESRKSIGKLMTMAKPELVVRSIPGNLLVNLLNAYEQPKPS